MRLSLLCGGRERLLALSRGGCSLKRLKNSVHGQDACVTAGGLAKISSDACSWTCVTAARDLFFAVSFVCVCVDQFALPVFQPGSSADVGARAQGLADSDSTHNMSHVVQEITYGEIPPVRAQTLHLEIS